LLEGVGKIDEYVKRAGELGINALAITDTSMFGAIEFFKKCKNAGIKPIIGLEIFLDGLEKVGEYSLTLLAKNQNGYKNLSKLSSLSYSRFTRKRNKIKYDELKKYSDDLYILSGGINSEAVKGILDLENTQVRKALPKRLFFMSKDNEAIIASSDALLLGYTKPPNEAPQLTPRRMHKLCCSLG